MYLIHSHAEQTCRVRGRRAHESSLHTGDPAHPGAAQPKKMELSEQEGSTVWRRPKARGLTALCRVTSTSLNCNPQENGDPCAKERVKVTVSVWFPFLFHPGY